MIAHLLTNQVFVMGTNADGFHGAGGAGFACRGDSRNTWREDPWFLAAIKAPVGSPERVGKWAVFGVPRGLQVGREGMSYGIQTIVRPGWKRSMPLAEIQNQLVALFEFAKSHPQLEFLMTPVGAGLSGWSDADMNRCFLSATATFGGVLPANIKIPTNLYGNPQWK